MEYRRRFTPTLQALFLVIIFLAMVGIFGLIWLIKNTPAAADPETDRYFLTEPTPGAALTAIENNAGIKIPAAARQIYAQVSGPHAVDAWVRLDLPAADLPQFLASARCQKPLAPTDPNAYKPQTPDAAAPDWWQPYQAKKLEECYGMDGNLFQHILADRTKTRTVTLYIHSVTDDFRTPTAARAG